MQYALIVSSMVSHAKITGKTAKLLLLKTVGKADVTCVSGFIFSTIPHCYIPTTNTGYAPDVEVGLRVKRIELSVSIDNPSVSPAPELAASCDIAIAQVV